MNSDNLNTITKILDFAIENEIEAADFYTELAGRQQDAALKTLLLQFAEEETEHQKKLEKAKERDLSVFAQSALRNLNLIDYMVEVEPGANMSYQDILILAMQKEKKAFSLYIQLAGMTEDTGMQDLFLMLAREEANHKLRFEIEYDNEILTEN